jgi:hypothetical protein
MLEQPEQFQVIPLLTGYHIALLIKMAEMILVYVCMVVLVPHPPPVLCTVLCVSAVYRMSPTYRDACVVSPIVSISSQ